MRLGSWGSLRYTVRQSKIVPSSQRSPGGRLEIGASGRRVLGRSRKRQGSEDSSFTEGICEAEPQASFSIEGIATLFETTELLRGDTYFPQRPTSLIMPYPYPSCCYFELHLHHHGLFAREASQPAVGCSAARPLPATGIFGRR